jgi:hypothetical protein
MLCAGTQPLLSAVDAIVQIFPKKIGQPQSPNPEFLAKKIG